MPRVNPGSNYFKEILELYQKADTFIREVESVSPELASRALNQLRWAGGLLLEALASDDQEEFDHRIRNTKTQCHCAMLEAAETGIVGLCQLLTEFDQDYKDVPVADKVPEYIEVRKLRAEIEKKLSDKNFTLMEHEVQTAELCAMFRKLKRGIDLLEASRIELDKAIGKKTREARKFYMQVVYWAVGSFLAALGLLAALFK